MALAEVGTARSASRCHSQSGKEKLKIAKQATWAPPLSTANVGQLTEAVLAYGAGRH